MKAGEDEEQSWKNVSSLDFKIIVGQFFHHRGNVLFVISPNFSNSGQRRGGWEDFERGAILVAVVRWEYKACAQVSIFSSYII